MRNSPPRSHGIPLARDCRVGPPPKGSADNSRQEGERPMSIEENKAVVGRWFTEFWGKDFNPAVIDELAAPDIRFEYSLHAPLRGRDAVRAFAGKFRAAFPDLNFWGTADLIAEGDYVVGQWEGGGTHTGDAFGDLTVRAGLPVPELGKVPLHQLPEPPGQGQVQREVEYPALPAEILVEFPRRRVQSPRCPQHARAQPLRQGTEHAIVVLNVI